MIALFPGQAAFIPAAAQPVNFFAGGALTWAAQGLGFVSFLDLPEPGVGFLAGGFVPQRWGLSRNVQIMTWGHLPGEEPD